MNTHAQSNAAQRVLVLMLAAAAFAFSACGTEPAEPQGASPVEDEAVWSYSPYPHRVDQHADRPQGTASLRAPRAMGGDPTVVTVPHPPRPTV